MGRYRIIGDLVHNTKRVGIVVIDKDNDNSGDYPDKFMLENPMAIKIPMAKIARFVFDNNVYSKSGKEVRGRIIIEDIPKIKHKPLIDDGDGLERIRIKPTTEYVYNTKRGGLVVGYRLLNISKYPLLYRNTLSEDIIIKPDKDFNIIRDSHMKISLNNISLLTSWGNEIIEFYDSRVYDGDPYPEIVSESDIIETASINKAHSSEIQSKYKIFTNAVEEQLSLLGMRG